MLMEARELKERLELHKKWLNHESGGQQLDLSGRVLMCANFVGADLRNACFQNADLQGAALQFANLCWANLQGADLRNANLGGAILRAADLRGAKLECAKLNNVNLCDTLTSEPIWSFTVGKHTAIATKNMLHVGSESHPWGAWLKSFEKIVEAYEYTKEEISNYVATIRFMYGLIQKQEQS